MNAARVTVAALGALALSHAPAHALNYPCSGAKGGVAQCDGKRFMCRDGSISGSRKKCTPATAEEYRQRWDLEHGKTPLYDEPSYPPPDEEPQGSLPPPLTLSLTLTIPQFSPAPAAGTIYRTEWNATAPELPPVPRLADMSTTTATIVAATLHAILLAAHDGDTITVQADGREETVRILNIDTPEMPPLAKCDAEAVAAKGARAALLALAPLGSPVTLHVGQRQRDKYQRLLATVELPSGVDLGKQLVEQGFARPWRGHREPWCVVGGAAVYEPETAPAQ